MTLCNGIFKRSVPIMLGLQLTFCLLAGQTNATPENVDNFIKRISWGQQTNGLRLGVEISSFKEISTNLLPSCCLYVQNIGSNFVYYRIPSFKNYEIRLLNANGQQFDWPEAKNDAAAGLQRKGGSGPEEAGQLKQIAFFNVPEKFSTKTNGDYQLIVSLRCCTNIAGVFGKRPEYFHFPPVTNKFKIYLP